MNRKQQTLTAAIIIFFGFAIVQGVQGAELSGEVMIHRVFPTGELDRRFNDTFGGAFGLTYMYTEYAGVTTSMNYFSLSRDKDGSDFTIWHMHLNGVIAYPFMDRFRAYCQAGLGVYLWNTDRAWWTDFHPKDGANLGFNYGLGLNYRIGNEIDALVQFNRHGLELTDRDTRVYWNEISLGMRFLLDVRILEH